ncbi:TPA: DNA phosphorothioation system sulfurtransferase DndC, partial [Citrobacter freundii]|nr:DNA phosphorothioation system sulfurtransferase DndC [Citrobacter freundii]
MSKLTQAYDLADYEEFINQEQFAGHPLAEYVAEVQRVYCADKRPWVIGYSGGKDSSAVITLVYLALLGLPPEMRTKDIFVVSSDTLVETPVVVDLIKKTMQLIEAGAKRDGLPITQHAVMPKTHETFWVN